MHSPRPAFGKAAQYKGGPASGALRACYRAEGSNRQFKRPPAGKRLGARPIMATSERIEEKQSYCRSDGAFPAQSASRS